MAKAQAALEAATTARPMQKPGTSPQRLMARPPTGANTIRATANTLTSADAAVTSTLKLRAGVGQ